MKLSIEFNEEFPTCDLKPDVQKDHMHKGYNRKARVGIKHLCLFLTRFNTVEIRILKPYEEPVPKSLLKEYFPETIHREWFDEYGNIFAKPGDDEKVIGSIPIYKVKKSLIRLLGLKVNEDW